MRPTFIHLASFACLVLSLVGCPSAEPEPRREADRLPWEGVTLRLAVLDDPALAEAAIQARGEWFAQTGAEYEVETISAEQLQRAERLPADAMLCPSRMLGDLVERGLIAPVPEPITRGEQWGGIFELPKLREAAWGKRTMAVPFGSPVYCCYYRAELLEKLGRRPPQTWGEHQELAELLAKNSPPPMGHGPGVSARWSGAIEPLAPGWAGLTLLARAAPYAKHRNNYSTLFDIETMKPLIAEPPFVEALEELAAAARFGPDDPMRYDPAGAREAFWRGECGMAITWPTAAVKERRKKGEGGRGSAGIPPPVGFAQLPGSRRVYNLAAGQWDKRAEIVRVPLLAVSGRLGVASKASPHREAAFHLLLWLSDERISPQLSALSPATTMFRLSNLDAPGQWVEETTPHWAAVQYGEVALASLGHQQWLAALRIPGRADYLAALDEAVAAVVRGEKSPQEALDRAAAKWREITARLGPERQKAAYRHGVGL